MSNRVANRAQRIYDYLKQRQGEAFRKADVLNALDLNDSKTTRTAIKRARELAQADGLYMAIPVYENGYTTCVTDDPRAAMDAALWLVGVENGVRVPRHIADEFVKARMSKLSPSERAYVHLTDKLNDLVKGTQDAAQEVVNALVKERREARREQDSQ